MYVEENDVKGDGKGNKTGRPGHEVFDNVRERFGAVAKLDPKLFNRIQTDQKDNEKSHKLYGNGPAEQTT